MSPAAADVWSTPAFVEELSAWVAGVVGGAVEPVPPVHVRPWSAAVRCRVEGRADVWAKANAAGTRHEPALTAQVSSLAPHLVPAVLGHDEARGWWVMGDAGTSLRASVPVEARWSLWEALLPRCAELQVRSFDAASAVAVRRTGLPEVTPVTLPLVLDGLVEDLSARDVGEGGLDADDRRRLDERRADVERACAELAASGVPDAIQHDDLHAGNVCVGGDGEGGGNGGDTAVVIDWGDASWGFPLGTMLVTLDAVAGDASCAVDDPRVVRVRDAYLEPFTARWPAADLVRWTELARWLGAVTRARSWQAALADAPPAARQTYGANARTWLRWLADGVSGA